MANFPIQLQPGMHREGTRYQDQACWRDGWGVRWYDKALGPINGWRLHTSLNVSGAPRAALSWKDNGSRTWLAVATHSHLFASARDGAVWDITPPDFVAGRADAIAAGGYGQGIYNIKEYGTPRPGTLLVRDATQWSLDTWGEYLLSVSPDDRIIYQWRLDVVEPAVAVPAAPRCSALITTAERFVFALGTDDPRTVSWSDQENIDDWAPSSTNQAGSFPLQTAGRLMCGSRIKGWTLLLTDMDAHVAVYIGGTLVYAFDRVGDACGAISRQAVASFEQQAVWMSSGGFWLWNGGAVVPLPCAVMEYIRADINMLQMSKIVATVNSANFEIEWRYCWASSIEIDRCVIWQYKDNYWIIGRAARTCGVDRGVFQYPILIDADGAIWEHEVGWDYGGQTPFAKTGPIELGNGDKIMHVMGLVSDDATVGDVTAAFTVRRNTDDPGVEHGPYSLNARADTRFSGGLVEMTVAGARHTNWRFGTPKLEIMVGEGR